VLVKLNVFFSGNLNSKVDSCPPFPGKERHLLRETIARITHGTEICPKDMYAPDEENEGEYKFNEEFAMPNTAALNDTTAWVHKHPYLLKAGRASHLIPTDMAEDEEYKAKLEENDKAEDRFREIGGEGYNPYPGLEVAWTTKICGDNQ
jgi:radial spoke head protein 4A